MKFISKLREMMLGESPPVPSVEVTDPPVGEKKEKKPREQRPAHPEKTEESKKEDPPEEADAGRREKYSFLGDGMSGIFNRVILPEERTFRNYIDPGFWNTKREEYRALRMKEKADLDVYRVLAEGAMPTIEYYVLTVISCVVATSGLIQGSTAVIIGAMIIAPLMTPILSFSLAIIWGDILVIKIALKSLLKGIVLTIAISSLIAYLLSMPDYSPEIIARTNPSAFDIIVALASGVVGAYGYSNKRISATLVGIAIAVALMPPLCVVGIGLGTMNMAVAGGAALLFAINLVSISLAGAVVFLAMKIHPLTSDESVVRKRALSHIVFSIAILTAIAIPVGFYMREGYLFAQAKKIASQTIRDRMPGISVMDIQRVQEGPKYRFIITLTGEVPPDGDRLKEIADLLKNKTPQMYGIGIRFIQSSQTLY